MIPIRQVRNRNGAARARRGVRHAPWLETLEGRALLTTITQLADTGAFTSVMPSGAIDATEGLGTGSMTFGNGDLDRLSFSPFNPTLTAVSPPGQPFALGSVNVSNIFQHTVGTVTSATLTVQMQFSYIGDTAPLTHMLQFTTQVQVAYSQVSLPPGPPVTQHTITVNPVVFTTSNVLPGSDLQLNVLNLPASLSPMQDSTGALPIMAEFTTAPAAPDVTIDLNDTTAKSDDITLYNPPGSAQPFTQTIPARVTNTGAAGTIQLSVDPAGAATLSQTSVDLAAGASTEVTVTPTAVSHAVNDVKIVAMRNGAVAGSQTMTIVSVTLPQHVRNADTPAGMPDRIPPRVNTQVPITVTPNLGSSGLSVTLVIDSVSPLDGETTINGQDAPAVTSSGNVNLSGTLQTAATGGADAGGLRLGVQVRGADTAVRSAGFSVAAIPENWVIAFQGAARGPDRGFITTDTFGSDSGNVSDLTAVDVSEVIQIVGQPSGSLARFHVSVGGYFPATVAGPAGSVMLNVKPDTMSIPVSALAKGLNDHFNGGRATLAQVHKFRDKRTGAADLPIANSGYTIVYDINLPPRSHVWHLTTTKSGAQTTAQGISSAAGAGGPITTDATQANPLFSGP